LQYARIAQAQSAPPTKHLFDTIDDLQTIFTIAVAEPDSTVVPEPSSLVIAMTLFGGLGLAGVWRRSRHRHPVTEFADSAGCRTTRCLPSENTPIGVTQQSPGLAGAAGLPWVFDQTDPNPVRGSAGRHSQR
jgi:hypothetical protein